MWVVCINCGICEEAYSSYVNLTVGKHYFVTYVVNNQPSLCAQYRITNDRGDEIFYSANRFVSVSEYRGIMLGELLEF